jgi:hypothetical protein
MERDPAAKTTLEPGETTSRKRVPFEVCAERLGSAYREPKGLGTLEKIEQVMHGVRLPLQRIRIQGDRARHGRGLRYER